jgi:hypothetical protein
MFPAFIDRHKVDETCLAAVSVQQPGYPQMATDSLSGVQPSAEGKKVLCSLRSRRK